jgi:dipeptidyl aminopeptidase/acylaminoacyl peptidase
VDHDYVEYPREGHGFRDPEVRVDAMQRELAFVRKALGIDDSPSGVSIDH